MLILTLALWSKVSLEARGHKNVCMYIVLAPSSEVHNFSLAFRAGLGAPCIVPMNHTSCRFWAPVYKHAPPIYRGTNKTVVS